MKLAILSATVGAACAFTPSTSRPAAVAPLSMVETAPETVASEEAVEVVETPEPVVPAVAPINGWVPDETLPCYGLPGATAPFGFFDPLGFTKDMEQETEQDTLIRETH